MQGSLEDGLEIYGLIGNIVINDDSLCADVYGICIPPNTPRITHNRNLLSKSIYCAWCLGRWKRFITALPPRPPLSLDAHYLATMRAGALHRHRQVRLLRPHPAPEDQPVEEILTAHLARARQAHARGGRPDWYTGACKELIVLLRDDYEGLMNVLNALAELE